MSGRSQSAARDVTMATTVAPRDAEIAAKGAKREARIAHKNRRQGAELDATNVHRALKPLTKRAEVGMQFRLLKRNEALADVYMIAAATRQGLACAALGKRSRGALEGKATSEGGRAMNVRSG